jgi:uncharacterized membrane protein YphA (DoxX/SURF4 family)
MKADKFITILRIVLGINFLWFGVLKLFPLLSPAEELATITIDWMFQGLIPATISIKLLAIWEIVVGIGLIAGVYLRYILPLFILHMSLTFLPLFVFPEITFTQIPYGLTIVGQYIIKNIVFLTLGLFLYMDTKEKNIA